MAIRSSGYYNNPQFAQAAAGLASLFAPPSGADAAGWAAANAKSAEARRLAELFDYAKSQGVDQGQFDRMGVAVGNYAPTQSYYAVNTDAATRMRGQDIDANTSRANNANTVRGGVLSNLYGPLNPGQIRPDVPANIAGAVGMPAMPGVAGAEKPLSETELKARILAELPAGEQRAAALGSTPVENVVTPNGPQVAWRADAVGQTPFVNKGAEAKPQNYLAPSGQRGTATTGPDGKLVDTQTGQPLPPGSSLYSASAQGTVDEIGVGKPVANAIDNQLIDISIAKDTAVKLRNLIQASPASQGAVGWIRGTAQNVLQTGGELGQFFGGKVAEVTDEIKKGAADASLAQSFDPNIPAIEMLANLLAFQYAKTTTGERLSNEMLRASRTALGLDGITSNQADAIARLNQAIERIGATEGILQRAKGGTAGIATPTPAPAPVPGAAGTPTTPAPAGNAPVLRYNPATGRIE